MSEVQTAEAAFAETLRQYIEFDRYVCAQSSGESLRWTHIYNTKAKLSGIVADAAVAREERCYANLRPFLNATLM
jgi:hypothetical protein